ncbi:Uncharacterised protein [Streptococcus pneumoniae]|nr:Uncharacterised protein [Streptococcus pneumoniae]CRG03009.1 Uncharacterised protein [Streptococcus pneumoniae]
MSSPSISALTSGYFLSAATAAFVKNDMKPNLVPSWSLMNCSFLRLRKSITFVISTSLKVVNIAVLLDTSNNFLAAVFFLRDIFSRITGLDGLSLDFLASLPEGLLSF